MLNLACHTWKPMLLQLGMFRSPCRLEWMSRELAQCVFERELVLYGALRNTPSVPLTFPAPVRATVQHIYALSNYKILVVTKTVMQHLHS